MKVQKMSDQNESPSRPNEPKPDRLGGDASPHLYPVRRKLPHGPPPFPVSGPFVQFVTINAQERGGKTFLDSASQILAAARFYHEHRRWFLHLFLLMPDHLHMLASFPDESSVKAVCSAWKSYLRRNVGIRFQSDCFEHRIRNAAEFTEKWSYIRENPVRKGLVSDADEWPYWMAFEPRTGTELTPKKGEASQSYSVGQGVPAEPTKGWPE